MSKKSKRGIIAPDERQEYTPERHAELAVLMKGDKVVVGNIMFRMANTSKGRRCLVLHHDLCRRETTLATWHPSLFHTNKVEALRMSLAFKVGHENGKAAGNKALHDKIMYVMNAWSPR